MEIKVGDLVFVNEKDYSLYQMLDTDPRFLTYGKVLSVNKNICEVDTSRNDKTSFLREVDSKYLMSFEEYITRAMDVSFHLKCNYEIAEEINKKSISMD